MLAILTEHLRELQEARQTDRKTSLLENLPPDGVLDPLQVIDFAAGKVRSIPAPALSVA